MAGITDSPYRKICRSYGAGLTTSEMITSNVSLWHSKKSAHRLIVEDEPIASVQIAGSDPRMLAEAAKAVVGKGAKIVDINMGCPAKKVCKKLAGSALLADEVLVAQILNSVVNAIEVPVTLKTRTGWSQENKNGVKVAKIAEENGIAAIAVHGRTRACRFTGHAEYDTVRQIAEAVSIPVIVNGDIDSASKAQSVLSETGAQAVMIGRASWGNPWIFKTIDETLRKKSSDTSTPTESEIISTIEQHFIGLYKHYGDISGLRIARKHFQWYSQTFGLPNWIVKEFNKIEDNQLQLDSIRIHFKEYINHEEKVA